MSIKMKALRSFRGERGEGNVAGDDRMVESGGEFPVSSERRAEELERIGHAVPVVSIATPAQMVDVSRETGVHPEIKASDAGPLLSHGGETGAGPLLPSSGQGRQASRRRSRSSKGEQE